MPTTTDTPTVDPLDDLPTGALSPEQISEVEERAQDLYEIHQRDRRRLDTLRAYLRGDPDLVWLPTGTPRELQVLAKMARFNMCDLVVRSSVQQLTVDGFTRDDDTAAETTWEIWQANRWDRKQLGTHKATRAYGVAYSTIDPPEAGRVPTLRPLSPRQITATYDTGGDWPDLALERRPDGEWWLRDQTSTYALKWVKGRKRGRRTINFEYVDHAPHGMAVTPVVRYLADEDLDDPVRGDIEPVMSNQDQINLTGFHLLVAQHYGAHGRKILIGRMVKQLEEQLRASAGSTLTVTAEPDAFKVEELTPTPLDGFIAARDAATRFLAALSQTPVHELLGTMANLASATLVEARESAARKGADMRTVIGESHEQMLGQAATLRGVAPDPAARVRWKPIRDQRTIQLVDTLATMAERLNVPREALWEQTPFDDDTIKSWREAAAQPGADPAGSPGQ